VIISNDSGAAINQVNARHLHATENVEEVPHQLLFVSHLLDHPCTAPRIASRHALPVNTFTAATPAFLAMKTDHTFALEVRLFLDSVTNVEMGNTKYPLVP
jgi:hypothetical protein